MTEPAGGSTSAPEGDVAIPASPSPTFVDIGACRCPGRPHESDWVALREHATIPMGMASRVVIREAVGDQERMEAGLALVFMRFGISAWSFVERDGPLPVSEPIRRDVLEAWLPFERGGLEVAEAANDLYGKDVIAPFRRRSPIRSPAGPGEPSTSATNGSGPTPRKRSKRSSPHGTVGKRSTG